MRPGAGAPASFSRPSVLQQEEVQIRHGERALDVGAGMAKTQCLAEPKASPGSLSTVNAKMPPLASARATL